MAAAAVPQYQPFNPQGEAGQYEEYYRSMPAPPPPQMREADYKSQATDQRSQASGWKQSPAPADYRPRNKKVIIEEVYPQGATIPPQYTNARFEELSDSEDDDYEIKVRRQIAPRRARSADSGPATRSRGSASGSQAGSRRSNNTRRRSAYDSDTEDDSEDDRDDNNQNTDRRVIKAVHGGAYPCGPKCPDNANRNSHYKPPRTFPLPDSDSEYDSDDDAKAEKSRTNKRRLYQGLAVLSTVGAASGFYHNLKAAKGRREALKRGDMCQAEYKNQQWKMYREDALAGVILAVGVNNMIRGWRRTAELRKQEDECRSKWDRLREERDQRLMDEEEDDEYEDERRGGRDRRKSSAGGRSRSRRRRSSR